MQNGLKAIYLKLLAGPDFKSGWMMKVVSRSDYPQEQQQIASYGACALGKICAP